MQVAELGFPTQAACPRARTLAPSAVPSTPHFLGPSSQPEPFPQTRCHPHFLPSLTPLLGPDHPTPTPSRTQIQTLREERLAEKERVSIFLESTVLGGGLGQGSGCSPPPGVTFKVCNTRCSASPWRPLTGPGIELLVAGRRRGPRAGQGHLGPLGTLTEHPPGCCLSSFWPVDFLRNFFSQTLGLGTQKERLLDELTLEGVTRYMQSERCESSACTGPLPLSWPQVT